MRTQALRFVSALAALGCVGPPGVADDEGSEEPCEFGCGHCSSFPSLPFRAIDILIVVDGGPNSHGAQARLAAGLDTLVAELESAPYALDYRIGITTTDMGPSACDPVVTTPEFGGLVATSCRARLGDFVDGEGEDHSALCTDRCTADSLEWLPTLVFDESDPAPRPWLERDGAQINVSGELGMAEALRCMAMVGVGGCAIESPFAAIEAVKLGSDTPGHPSFGFFRYWAKRAIIVVSDGSECSWTPGGEAIFDPDGLRTFWSDKLADAATPAVCWNAGTNCQTIDGVMDCEVGYDDASGAPVPFPGPPALQRPVDIVDMLEDYLGWGPKYLFFLGVPVEGVEFLEFAPAEDPAFDLEFGIGPSCEGPDGTVGLPPVRTLDVIDRSLLSFDEVVESICSEEFSSAFARLGSELAAWGGSPACVPTQLCDVVPDTPELDVDCRVTGSPYASAGEQDVPECARGSDGAYLIDPATDRPAMPGPEHEVCHLLGLDADAVTADPWDDLDPACVTGWPPNVQIELVTVDGRVPELQASVSCAHPTD